MRKRSNAMRVATAATSAALALGLGGAMAAGLALAAPGVAGAASGTVNYACTFPVINKTYTIPITMSATVPASVTPGQTFSITGFQTTSVIPAAVVNVFVFLKYSDLAGTVTSFTVNATGATPASLNAAATPFSFKVPIQQSAAATIVTPTTPISVGPFTAGSSGTVSIVPGNVEISSKVGSSTVNVPCTTTATAAVFSIPISSAATTTTAAGTTTTASVPPPATGEPWSGWPYWMIIAIFGGLGLFSVERAIRLRRNA
ncbi:MAG TPA: DUF6801 domain-containing protein [Acidimicrobiales bacterium]|nr:DUF6801 domain-containing protein [Acidimicrobiales bacterium]